MSHTAQLSGSSNGVAHSPNGFAKHALPARLHPADLTPKLERRWFEFDRNAVLRQIDSVRRTIDQNAGDLEMVAEEGVFDKPLSAELSRAALSLHSLGHELNALRGQVARANGYPSDDKKLA
jgi:hypothetical protein